MRWEGGPAWTPLGEGGAGFGVLGVEGAVLKTGSSSSDDAGEAIKKIIFKTEQKPFLNRVKIQNSKKSF